MASVRRTQHVGHPILRLDVLGPDGRVQSHERVFCQLRKESVPVGLCSTCGNCDGITEGPNGVVECTIPLVRQTLGRDRSGERTAVGEILTGTTLVVEQGMTLKDALQSLERANVRSLAIVDPEHVLVGVLHESRLPPSLDSHAHAHAHGAPDLHAPFVEDEVTSAMSSALAVHEGTPIRHALRLLATRHLRQIIVVAGDGTPLGLFRDVDGLRWIGSARHAPIVGDR